jgi:hypothetical protein
MSILAADVPTVRPAILRGLKELADDLVRRLRRCRICWVGLIYRADRIALHQFVNGSANFDAGAARGESPRAAIHSVGSW